MVQARIQYMNSPPEKFDVSLAFRVARWLICPFMFCGFLFRFTLAEDDFTWANGSYAPVFFSWLVVYVFWAYLARYESAVSGFMLNGKPDAKKVGDKMDTLFAQYPFLWPAWIEFLVFWLTIVVAMYFPEFGFQFLWLTVGHFVFVLLWRTIALRLQAMRIAT